MNYCITGTVGSGPQAARSRRCRGPTQGGAVPAPPPGRGAHGVRRPEVAIAVLAVVALLGSRGAHGVQRPEGRGGLSPAPGWSADPPRTRVSGPGGFPRPEQARATRAVPGSLLQQGPGEGPEEGRAAPRPPRRQQSRPSGQGEGPEEGRAAPRPPRRQQSRPSGQGEGLEEGRAAPRRAPQGQRGERGTLARRRCAWPLARLVALPRSSLGGHINGNVPYRAIKRVLIDVP